MPVVSTSQSLVKLLEDKLKFPDESRPLNCLHWFSSSLLHLSFRLVLVANYAEAYISREHEYELERIRQGKINIEITEKQMTGYPEVFDIDASRRPFRLLLSFAVLDLNGTIRKSENKRSIASNLRAMFNCTQDLFSPVSTVTSCPPLMHCVHNKKRIFAHRPTDPF
jgi:hypothetical protein